MKGQTPVLKQRIRLFAYLAALGFACGSAKGAALLPPAESQAWTGYIGARSLIAEDNGLERVPSGQLADPLTWCGGLVLQDQGKTLYWLDPRRDRINVVDPAGNDAVRPLSLNRPLNLASRLEAGPKDGVLWCMENDGRILDEISVATNTIRTVAARTDGPWSDYAAPSGAGPAAAFEDPAGRIWLVPSSGTARIVATLPETWAVRSAFFVQDELFVFKADTHQLMSLRLNGMRAGDWPNSATISAVATLQPVAQFGSSKFVWPADNPGGMNLTFGWDQDKNSVEWHGADHSEDGKFDIIKSAVVGDPATDDIFFRETVALCFDPLRDMLYAADPASAGILGIRTVDNKTLDMAGKQLSGQALNFLPPMGASRTLLFGGSSSGRVVDAAGGDDFATNPRSFTDLVEPMYNLERARRAWPGRMQTLILWHNLSFTGSPVGFALAAVDGLNAARISRVIIDLTPLDPIFEAESYKNFPVPDDLSDKASDPEWAIDTLPNWRGSMGPLTLAWIKALQAHASENQDIYTLRADGAPIFTDNGPRYRLFGEPEIASAMMARYGHALDVLKERLRRKGVALTVVILPERNQVGSQELVGGGRAFDSHVYWTPIDVMAACLKNHGIPFVDLSRQMQAMDPGLWPTMVPGNDHFKQVGHWMIAYALAQALNDLDGPNFYDGQNVATSAGQSSR